MLRLEDLASYLVTIRNAVAEDIQPDLRSNHVKAEAGTIVTLLDRLATALETGEGVAAACLGDWQRIRADGEQLGLITPVRKAAVVTGFLASMQNLRVDIDGLQSDLRPQAGLDALVARLRAHDGHAERWFAHMVAALEHLAEATEPQVAAPKVRGDGAPLNESERLRIALSAYLRRRYPDLPPDAVSTFRISPGGNVKQTSIFTLVPNDILPLNLVLRRDLRKSITGSTVVDEFPTIERVFGLGLPVPRPILVESDPFILDGPFMIMTEVTNAVPAGTYFPEERRYFPRTMGPDFGKEVAAVLARLHSATRVDSAAPTANIEVLIAKSRETWRALGPQPFSLAAELSFAWLFSHPLPVTRPHCLTHGDAGAHNMMARDGHLAALLDWELADFGDPALDLAECRMMLLPDVMPWEDFVREYVAAGGDPEACEPNAVGYYCVWTYLKHSVMNGTLRRFYHTGERDDAIAASVAGHYFYRLVIQYLARALQIAIDASREFGAGQ